MLRDRLAQALGVLVTTDAAVTAAWWSHEANPLLLSLPHGAAAQVLAKAACLGALAFAWTEGGARDTASGVALVGALTVLYAVVVTANLGVIVS